MRLCRDLVEEILKRLPVKSLVRFKLVSKQWQMMIESQHFETKHLKHRQSQEPDFLLIVKQYDDDVIGEIKEIVFSKLVLDSSDSIGDHQDLQPEGQLALSVPCARVSRGCDGLVCIYDNSRSILVVNPSTKWMREVSPPTSDTFRPNNLGFGKDICTGTYKLVWLFHPWKGTTTCEVFDFNTNTWRYVESPPHQMIYMQRPVYVDGSLHWLIVYVSYPDIKILSFDCHTETFQVFSEFPDTKEDTPVYMHNINNRLCVSKPKRPTYDTWALNRSNMTWEKMFSLDLSSCPSGVLTQALWEARPLAILKKKKLLLFDQYSGDQRLFIYDLETRSYSLCFVAKSAILLAPYFQSLKSIGQQKEISIA